MRNMSKKIRQSKKDNELSEVHDVDPLVASCALSTNEKYEWLNAKSEVRKLSHKSNVKTREDAMKRYSQASNIIRRALNRKQLDVNGLPAETEHQKVVLRFWIGKTKLPDFTAAKTWSEHGFKQKVYTDHPNFPVFVKGVEVVPYDLLAEYPEFGPAAPQHYKDFFQFEVVSKQGGWFVDFDFALVNPDRLPKCKIVLNSELGKKTGIMKTSHLLKGKQYRLHLGVSKFPKGHQAAKKIRSTIYKKLCESKVVLGKDHNKWITFCTIAAQDVLRNEGLLRYVVPPVVLNPHWLGRNSKVGTVKFGMRMPSIQEAKEKIAAMSYWEGFKFPRKAISRARSNA